MARRILLLLVLLGLEFGCAPAWTPVRADDAFRATALSRASFELGCPAEQIQVTPLTANRCQQRADGPYVCAGEQMGVTGCGKKTTYVFPPLGRGDTWVRNGEVLSSEGAPAP